MRFVIKQFATVNQIKFTRVGIADSDYERGKCGKNDFWNGFKNDEKRSEFGLGSAFFGISDPGLVKKSFFETFLSQDESFWG